MKLNSARSVAKTYRHMKILLTLLTFPVVLFSCANLDSSFSALYQDPETGVVIEYKITEAKKAMEECDGSELDDRTIKCSEAAPRKEG